MRKQRFADRRLEESLRFVLGGPLTGGDARPSADQQEAQTQGEWRPTAGDPSHRFPPPQTGTIPLATDLPPRKIDLGVPEMNLGRLEMNLPGTKIDLPVPKMYFGRPEMYLREPEMDLGRSEMYLRVPKMYLGALEIDLGAPEIRLRRPPEGISQRRNSGAFPP
ncbi:MAG TPA: hypothetical protein VF121_01600 [Thermoanaerobaculia bacterium]|nr:hypothetical protein [Thermoanaerobaculia bacterium]